ncbi:MAG TPA: ATP-binding protein [Vicinamibacterales bacterium]|nr:ATP-binding protein [Vicinamibacterales bacterium]
MSIKAKQVAGVTTLVVLVVAIMSAWQMATLMTLRLEETRAGARLLSDALFQRTNAVLATRPEDAFAAIREDGGIRSILEASIAYSKNQHILYTAIVAPDGTAVAHAFPAQEGTVLPYREDFEKVADLRAIDQFLVVIAERQYEVKEPLLVGEQQFGSIRVGVSTFLIGDEMKRALWGAAQTAVVAMLVSMLVAMVLTQWMLRPIHVIQSGLSRLGRGELDVTLDLPGTEFKDLGSSFEAVSAQLAAVRAKALGVTGGDFESVMENLEDAVALFSPQGELIFSNAAMRALLPNLAAPGAPGGPAVSALAADHPVRQLVERALAGRKSQGPLSMPLGPPAEPDQEAPERLLLCHAIGDASGRFLGAMLVARNLGYLTQVHTTLNFSRKLAALGRLMAGVAHEVKNPLNAMTIHLELLKQKLMTVREPVTVAAGPGGPEARPLDLTKHVTIISDEIKRLDQVVVGFLKFARPDELKLQPLQLPAIINEVLSMTTPEAERNGVSLKVECADVPDINADPAMLQQALLNLTINACQAMPEGGTLKVACRRASRRRVEVDVEDTGVGIPPENLARIFDLYFTTKEKGSGIGLSMVFRIVQLHDGEVEVQSTPGRGTRFRLTFPEAHGSIAR